MKPSDTISRQGKAQLLSLTERYKVKADIITINDAGYIVRFDKKIPHIGNIHGDGASHYGKWDWPESYAPVICIDADDTIFDYTGTKKLRLQKYSEHIQTAFGNAIAPKVAEQLMKMTDRFARWLDGGATMYHISAHQWALGWVTAELTALEGQNPSDAEIEQWLHTIEQQFEAVKDGSSTTETPFSFEGTSLVIEPTISYVDIADVFNPVFAPQRYHDVLQAINRIASEQARVVVYTYGEPSFQLEKLLRLHNELADIGYDWPFADILLTTEPKGQFAERILAVSHQAIPIVKQDLFSDDPHLFILIDDDPKQLENFMLHETAIQKNSGAHLAVILSVKNNAQGEVISTPYWEAIERSLPHPQRRVPLVNGGSNPPDLLLQFYWTMQDGLHVLQAKETNPTIRHTLQLQQAHFASLFEQCLSSA